MISEAVAWTIVCICIYLIGYLTVGNVTNYVWKRWAIYKFGVFWEYGLYKGMRAYYPNIWEFVKYCNIAYSMLRVAFWPVTIPWQLMIQTKALNRFAACKYYYY